MATLLEDIGIKGGIVNQKRVHWQGFTFGDLFSFSYINPLNRRTLPFYDRTPLIIFTGFIREHRLLEGINFHYVFPFSARIRIMKRLFEVRNTRPRNFLHLAWPKRINKIGLETADLKSLLVAYRRYDFKRAGKPLFIDSPAWPQALATFKPKYIGANVKQVATVMKERRESIK